MVTTRSRTVTIEHRVRGRWRLTSARVAARLLPTRLAVRVARWAVRRVTVATRLAGGTWRHHHPHLDLTITETGRIPGGPGIVMLPEPEADPDVLPPSAALQSGALEAEHKHPHTTPEERR